MDDNIEPITPPKCPFNLDDMIFYIKDDEGNPIGEPYSYNQFIEELHAISGVNEDFLGEAE